MPAITPSFKVTDAGAQAFFQASQNGFNFITIKKVSFGSARYENDPTATTLVSEKARVTAAGMPKPNERSLYIEAIENGQDQDYEINEYGLHLDDANETLFAIASNNDPDPNKVFGYKTGGVTYNFLHTIRHDDYPPGSIVFANAAMQFPPATTDFAGRIELATQTEVDAGTDNQRAVTPATLRAYVDSAIASSGNASEAVADHEAKADPHTQYIKRAGDAMTGGFALFADAPVVQAANAMNFVGSNSFQIDGTATLKSINIDAPSPLHLFIVGELTIELDPSVISSNRAYVFPNSYASNDSARSITFKSNSTLTLTKFSQNNEFGFLVTSDANAMAHTSHADPHPQYATDHALNDAMAAHNGNPNPHPQYMSRDQSSAINLIQNSRFNDLPENSSSFLSTTAAFSPPSLLLPVSSTAGWQSIGRSYANSSTYGGSNTAIPAAMQPFTDVIGLGEFGNEYFGAQLTIDSTSSASFTQDSKTFRYLFQNEAEIVSNNSGWVEFSCWMKVVSGEVQSLENVAFGAKGATGYTSVNAISITPADGVVFLKLAWNTASGANGFAPFLGGIAGTVVQFVLPCITSGVFGVATTRRHPQPSIAAFQRKGEIVAVPMALIASGTANQSGFTTYNLPASIPKDARTVQLWISLTASNNNGSAGTSSRATAGRQQQILFGVGGQSGSGFIQGNNAVLAACLPSADGVASAKIDLLNQLTGTGNWQVYAIGYLA